MRLLQWGGLLVVALSVVAPAMAQFDGVVPSAVQGRELVVPGGPKPAVAPERPLNYSVALFPFTQFKAQDVGGSVTVEGVLFAAEAAFPASKSGSSYAVGGWWFFGDETDLYQLHGKYYFKPEWGAQLAWVGWEEANANDFHLLGLYNISSSKYAPRSKTPWNVQVGLGPYFFDADSYDTGFSGVLQGSVSFGKKQEWSVDASYWYINVSGDTLSRLGLGVSYKF